MVSKILHSSYIIDFLDVDFCSNEISEILQIETNKILETINIPSLDDWEIQFRATYGSRPPIRVYKKQPSYKSDKQKLIIVHIPIPTKDTVAWGVEHSQQVKLGIHPNEHKYCSYLDINPTEFNNRTEYIIKAMRDAILFCFKEGFTVNGSKVKTKYI